MDIIHQYVKSLRTQIMKKFHLQTFANSQKFKANTLILIFKYCINNNNYRYIYEKPNEKTYSRLV